MLDWLIVGGGVHGTYLSHVLLTQARVSAGRVRVLDPHDQPLEAFWRFTQATGMRYLRSPAVHHLDLKPHALRQFAKRGVGRRLARFAYPYDRPGLDFFRAHSEHVVKTNGLDQLRVRARGRKLSRIEGGYRVETERGCLESRRVVLAIGLGEQPCLPSWASAGTHIFDPRFDRGAILGSERVVIVGGGISSAQLACKLAREGTPVTVVARHAPRTHQFDSDPAWLGPKAMERFAQTTDLSARRRMIVEARHRGSVPPEVAIDLSRERAAGHVDWVIGRVGRAMVEGSGIRLELEGEAAAIRGAHLVLATGFEPHRPGGDLLDEDAIERLGLPCAACGYPIVSPQLEWAPGLFVSGPLAELELGPTARNISGARAAGERLLSAA
ncbi:MAG: NAD(P)-binding domain-containing protein [Myxococcales bacterium]|nr:NAD(P)-binding domain-containing protein [Myxococcales bacterium]